MVDIDVIRGKIVECVDRYIGAYLSKSKSTNLIESVTMAIDNLVNAEERKKAEEHRERCIRDGVSVQLDRDGNPVIGDK